MVGRSDMMSSSTIRGSKPIRHSSPCSVLPDEIIFDEILMSIPLLCLVRLRSVCKSWCSILSSPTFMSAYHKRHRSIINTDIIEFYRNHSQIHHYSYDNDTIVNQITKLDLPAMLVSTDDTPFVKGTFYKVVAYCDGIMCFLLRVPKRTVHDPYTEQILLWDLTLGKTTLTLPSSYNYFTYGIHNHQNIIFGIGYDDKVSHEYKVFRASIFPGESRETVVVQANVYSLILNTWRSFAVTLPRVNPNNTRGVYVDGVLYWLDAGRSLLITFCLANEVFDHIPLLQDILKKPGHRPYTSIWHVLINLEMGGEPKLGTLTQSTTLRNSTSVGLWVRLDSNSWTKLYDIDIGIPMRSYRIINHQFILGKSADDGQWFGYDCRTFKKVSVIIKVIEEVDDPCHYLSSLFC